MEDHEKPTKRKDQIRHDEEVVQRLQAQMQAELEEENRLKLFNKAMKRVNTFVDIDTELVEGSEVRAEGSETRAKGSSKRAGEELEHENVKKQKVDDDKEIAELKNLMEVMPDKEEVALDAIPLVVKSPSIID
ncbi:hypothetical protein Tco_0895073 [Tanacetum coccineum]|uniref:Uncharacterized protein n=1 Tax=Tanacetum coccineum TaxID=301880 RepID=A0ABQ5CDK8_9ASTR